MRSTENFLFSSNVISVPGQSILFVFTTWLYGIKIAVVNQERGLGMVR